jgi:hypothetical protein
MPMTGFETEFGLPQVSDHNHGLRGVPVAVTDVDGGAR